ncbi:uncharacterized protein BO95DRAFT_479438 [Aspergillus brunneoviolaceus CBS 621.78]|uniref:Uncharacterized protein n=1 Tax=Aspergillus brunneoviolaceus CBS 621.78 TaxID=1450534 RepID=A0ACD1GJU1_9EURO|nr:hypothetical protein BO95DRAFT_479438 [Aspergillus brunneoviolaceus CBS 621.78]RAH49505.1 hypothetical protein BO95DRAFT_479438 [Aspergillus brunneoviolaceus CBS 621.78]
MKQDQNSHLSRRPRRPSITQQIQRALGFDKQTHLQDKQGQSPKANSQATRPGPEKAATQRPNSSSPSSSGHSQISTEEGQHGDPRQSIGDVGIKRLSASLLNGYLSKRTGASLEGDVAVTSNNKPPAKRQNVAPRNKETRATKRLEADRAELEKQLLRLEQAGESRTSRLLKRETRRLSKKQPLDRRSRASSASADDLRSSTRLSSMFSISRRSSRSRPSSAHEADQRLCQQSSSTAKSRQNANLHPEDRTVLKAPERFSIALSKEFTAANALLSYHKDGPPGKPTQSTADSHVNETSKSRLSHECLVQETSQGPVAYRNESYTSSSAKPELRAPKVSQKARDLDRTSFSAVLNTETRIPEVVQTSGRPMPIINPAVKDTQDTRADCLVFNPGEMEQSAARPHPQHPNDFTISQQEPWKASSARTPNYRQFQRQYRKYQSSPLAVTSVGDLASGPASTNPTSFESSTQFAVEKSRQVCSNVLENGIIVRSSPVRPLPINHHGLGASSERANTHRPAYKDCDGDRPMFSNKRPQHTSNDSTYRVQDEKIDSSASNMAEFGHSHDARANLHSQASVGYSAGVGQSQTKALCKLKSYLDHEPCPTKSKWTSEVQNPQVTHTYSAGQPQLYGNSLSSLDNSSREMSADDYNTADEGISVASRSRDENEFPAMCLRHPGIENPRHDSSACLSPARKQSPAAISGTLLMQTKNSGDQPKYCPGRHVSKIFLICCVCGQWHDNPSQMYSEYLCSKNLPTPTTSGWFTEEREAAVTDKKNDLAIFRSGQSRQSTSQPCTRSASDRPSLTAQSLHSCWCGHKMNQACCEGWSTVVHLRKKCH